MQIATLATVSVAMCA